MGAGLALLPAKTPPARPTARNQIRRTCTRCHGLDVVRAQRLSRAEWEQELDKMTRMGAKIEDREAVLDYLAKWYGDSQPPKER